MEEAIKKLHWRCYLDEALTGAGIVGKTVAYRWILKMERAGRLVIPRDPVTGWRKVTQRQAEEIVRAFSPHGSGYWKNGKKDEKI